MILILLMLASSALIIGTAVVQRTGKRAWIATVGYALLITAILVIGNVIANHFLVLHFLEQLVDQIGLRREWAWGATWLVSIVVSHFVGRLFSLQASERRVGELGLASLVALFFLIKIVGTEEEIIGKCVAWDENGVRRYDSQQNDSITGLPCVLITAENQAQLRPLLNKALLSSSRAGPARVFEGPFFVTRVGSDDPIPIVWYSRAENGDIELWDRFGVHPILGTRLQPITLAIAQEWERQQLPVRKSHTNRSSTIAPQTPAHLEVLSSLEAKKQAEERVRQLERDIATVRARRDAQAFELERLRRESEVASQSASLPRRAAASQHQKGVSNPQEQSRRYIGQDGCMYEGDGTIVRGYKRKCDS